MLKFGVSTYSIHLASFGSVLIHIFSRSRDVQVIPPEVFWSSAGTLQVGTNTKFYVGISDDFLRPISQPIGITICPGRSSKLQQLHGSHQSRSRRLEMR